MAGDRQVCTFFLDDLFIGIDTELVQEVIRYQEMTCVPLSPEAVKGLINLRGQIVTGIDLRRRFELGCRANDQRPMNVVIRTADGAVSLLVDEIGDVLELPEDAYEPAPDNLDGVARELIMGAYKLEDRLLLILDTNQATKLDS